MNVLLLTGIILVLDQISKVWIRSSLMLHESSPVIENFFHLTYVTNKGMAFGLNFPGGIIFFTLASLIMSGVLLYYLWKERQSHILLRISLAFILGGALGNLIDRIFMQKVVDFLDFMIGDYHWYIFNIADSSVTIGIVLFLWYSFFIQPKMELTETSNL